ncbi:MAG: hypothetical protein FWD78_04735 [Treponema sp.]|nr:hypothetical protein [Treponema sp.]
MIVIHTITVPADRRIILEIPPQIPAGDTARFEVTWFFGKNNTNFIEKTNDTFSRNKDGKILLTKEVKEQLLANEILRSLTGILYTDMTLDQIREERLAKYSK